MKRYKDLDKLPAGRADESVTEGCIVLEGGAWRGLYTIGVLDALMEENINFESTVGVSAGGLSAIGYLTGQIGWAARIDLGFRHDRRYCGTGAMRRDHGITGFSYLFRELMREYPMDKKRFHQTKRRMAVSATNMFTGQIEYFEKGKCNLSRAVQASATVPYISRPVVMNGVPYLDGGCAEKIPYPWAKESGAKKIVVVRTRERSYRRKERAPRAARMYRAYPKFYESLCATNAKFNLMVDEMEQDERDGKVFIIAPSRKVEISRFEGNMDKLGDLYWLGYQDMRENLGELRVYLEDTDEDYTSYT